MEFDFAELKRDSRRAVHDLFKVDATYTGPGGATPVPLHVRLHNKIVTTGDLQGNGYVEVLEGVDRIIFNIEELQSTGVNPVQNGILTFTTYHNVQFYLNTKVPMDGPIDVIWYVKRVE